MKKGCRSIIWPLLFLLLTAAVVPACAASLEILYAPGRAVLTLEEYLTRGLETWFLTDKKEYAVQAMMVSQETSFHNELEAADYAVTDDGVTVTLKGRFDEMQATKLSKVISTYTKPNISYGEDA